MASTSEVGHTINIASFNTTLQILEEMGVLYTPSNPTILQVNLQLLAADLNAAITAFNQKKPIHTNAVADREAAIAQLTKLTTIILNYFKSLNVADADKENVRSLVIKIRGDKRRKTTNSDASETKSISTYQLSYDSRIANFSELISLLASHPEYIPNAPEIQIVSLKEFHQLLLALTHSVNAAANVLLTARQKRNNLLYFQENNAMQCIKDIKSYLKSLEQTGHPYYKAVCAFKFKIIKRES